MEDTVEDADAVFIPRNQTVLDLSDWMYEFIMLSVPLQKVHPDDENGKPGCNPQALGLLQSMTIHEDQEQKKKDIWKGLEGLKTKKKKKS